MTHAVRITPLATADLLSIEDWIADQAGADIAKAYVDRLLNRITRLTSFPRRGTPRPEFGAGVRGFTFERRLLILYSVDVRHVRVLRVVNASRSLIELAIE